METNKSQLTCTGEYPSMRISLSSVSNSRSFLPCPVTWKQSLQRSDSAAAIPDWAVTKDSMGMESRTPAMMFFRQWSCLHGLGPPGKCQNK